VGEHRHVLDDDDDASVLDAMELEMQAKDSLQRAKNDDG